MKLLYIPNCSNICKKSRIIFHSRVWTSRKRYDYWVYLNPYSIHIEQSAICNVAYINFKKRQNNQSFCWNIPRKSPCLRQTVWISTIMLSKVGLTAGSDAQHLLSNLLPSAGHLSLSTSGLNSTVVDAALLLQWTCGDPFPPPSLSWMLDVLECLRILAADSTTLLIIAICEKLRNHQASRHKQKFVLKLLTSRSSKYYARKPTVKLKYDN